MIEDKLTFETVCDMVLGEMSRVAKFGHIKITPEQREEALQNLTEEERAYYDNLSRFSGRGPAYQQAFLGVKYIVNNLPDEPGFDDEFAEKTKGLSLNDLYNITVPAFGGKKILGKNQFQGLMTRPAGIANTLKGMIKWTPEGYVAGNAETPDVAEGPAAGADRITTPTSPMGHLQRKMGDQMPKHITDTEKIDSPALTGADEGEPEVDGDLGPDIPYEDPTKPMKRMGMPPSLDDEEEDLTPASERPEDEYIPVPDDEDAILAGDIEDIEDDSDIILGNPKKKKRVRGHSSLEDDLDDNALGIDPDVDAAYRDYSRSSDMSDY